MCKWWKHGTSEGGAPHHSPLSSTEVGGVDVSFQEENASG